MHINLQRNSFRIYTLPGNDYWLGANDIAEEGVFE